MSHMILSGFVLVAVATQSSRVPRVIITILTLGNLTLTAFVVIVTWMMGGIFYGAFRQWAPNNCTLHVTRERVERSKRNQRDQCDQRSQCDQQPLNEQQGV